MTVRIPLSSSAIHIGASNGPGPRTSSLGCRIRHLKGHLDHPGGDNSDVAVDAVDDERRLFSDGNDVRFVADCQNDPPGGQPDGGEGAEDRGDASHSDSRRGCGSGGLPAGQPAEGETERGEPDGRRQEPPVHVAAWLRQRRHPDRFR